MKREQPDQLAFSFENAASEAQSDDSGEESNGANSGPVEPRRVPEDQSSRDVIRTSLDTSLMVLAGAGAGKTYELVERMVATLAEDRDEPVRIRNIAAITFTRKAAGELRTRFYDRLQRAARDREWLLLEAVEGATAPEPLPPEPCRLFRRDSTPAPPEARAAGEELERLAEALRASRPEVRQAWGSAEEVDETMRRRLAELGYL